ncbi:MAG TPA: replicative DNA helicase [Bacteroidia bacterium]|jgi:replicative DNA helicase|nr:replicative DNA helicase [Bacteroidia bacterium]
MSTVGVNKPKLKLQSYTPPALDGKLQPQATELEEAVLGAMMLEKEALSTVIDILKPDAFYKPAHQSIYRAVVDLFNDSEPVDILTVTNRLKKNGELEIAGGAYSVAQLTNRVASSANAEYHARIILQKYIQRELIRISTDVINHSYEESSDVFDLLDKATASIYELVDANVRKQQDSISKLLAKAIEQIQEASQQTSGVTGVASGFTTVDRITGGWQKSDLIVLAARPAMGKTALVLTLARNAAVDFAKPVVVFSLEMSSLQLVNRLISAEAELEQDKIRKGDLKDYEFVQLNERISKLSKAPLFIDDTPALSIFELRAKARRLKENHDIQMIVIDYLQLMTAGNESGRGGGNREQEISYISRSLKSLAKELDIPIIALSQLSRDVEKRATGTKRPQLSDLRESGAIEQDADMVIFIYRPEYYGLDVFEDDQPSRGMAELYIAKNRHGSIAQPRVKFIGQFAKFADVDYVEGAKNIYQSNQNLTPNTEFMGEQTITVQSKKWDEKVDDTNNDIIKGNPNHDIEEDF